MHVLKSNFCQISEIFSDLISNSKYAFQAWLDKCYFYLKSVGVRHFVKNLLLVCAPLSPALVSPGVSLTARHLETLCEVLLSCPTEQFHQGIRMLRVLN